MPKITVPLVRAAVSEFERSIALIRTLDDIQYSRSSSGTGSVGGHIRHNLDFANSLLNGIAVGRIDYSERQRDTRVERDREFAVGGIEFVVARLSCLTRDLLSRLVLVRSETDRETWLTSSVARELEFLHSHTVHHHALVAEKLAARGVEVGEGFGVAPSTLKYWAENSKYTLKEAG